MMDILVNKDWTKEEALDADAEYLLSGGEAFGINSPFLRWSALHRLDEYQLRYEEGDKFALMLAIRACADFKFVMPEWVEEAYINSVDRVAAYEEKSWDDVFGKPIPKGANLSASRKKHLLEGRVYLKLREIILRNPERAIDAGLFEEAGAEFNVGKTLAEEFYRAMIKKGCDSLPEIKRDIDSPKNQIRKKMLQNPHQ